MTAPTAHPPRALPRLAYFPVTFFAVVMGLAGLALATHRVELWLGAGSHTSIGLIAVTALVFCTIAGLFVLKGLRHPDELRAEWNHPVRIAFFPAITIGALLIAAGLLQVSEPLARAIWIPAAVAHLVVTLGVVSAWISHRTFEQAHMTPAWFIPAVGNVLVPVAGVQLGYLEVSWFFFSVGMLFWLVFLTLVFNRLIFHNPLPERLLPTLVILIAPPSAGFVAWYQINGGEIDAVARLLYYCGLMFALITLTQVNKLLRLPFAMSWWAYSFPVAAFTIASSLFAEKTGHGFQQVVMLVSYVVLLGVIALLVLKTAGAIRRDEICQPEG
ncbi:SLAC1 anion channel family protein [Stappia stellulata]|uniref:SLAC1 anion channel family protein n=1 Tax=Stappia stellulata TaxID=71235 RepID=UPI001CD4FF49|nr:SLAC1 anion channel family protein [Stappia stellulata]MCA1241776.1 SLAC1 anion channel family protein [Stappia stellulata]